MTTGNRSRAERFTSPPWELGRGPKGALAIYRVGPCARELVAGFADRTVTQTDAQLMVAAPEMYWALKRVRSLWAKDDTCEETRAVDAAIAKAEGR